MTVRGDEQSGKEGQESRCHPELCVKENLLKEGAVC